MELTFLVLVFIALGLVCSVLAFLLQWQLFILAFGCCAIAALVSYAEGGT